jgi:hypothetical protein
MTNDIAYLDDLEMDLTDVARRETILRAAPGLGPGPGRSGRSARPLRPAGRRPGRRILALAAAAFVALAGVIGYIATRDGAPFGPRQRLGFAPVPAAASPAPARVPAALPSPVGAPGDGTIFAPAHGSFGSDFSGAPSAAPAPPDQVGDVPLAGPLIVKTADISLVVPRGHFAEVFNRATAIAGPLGGYVSSSSSVGVSTHSGSLTIRVPSGNFDGALAALRKLGRVQAQTVHGDDVTAQYVDLNARLRTWEAQEQALLKLMAKATTVAETLRVQGQLQRVQLTIEQLKGQIRLLQDRTSNATLEVSISEPAPKTRVTTVQVQNPSFGTAMRRAVAGLLGVVVAVLIGFGYLIPIALLALLAWLVVRRVQRRRYATA